MDPKDIPTGIQHVQPDSKKQELVEYRLDIPDPVQQFSDKLKNLRLEHLACGSFFLTGNENKLYLPPKNMSLAYFLLSIHFEKFEVNEGYNQEFYYSLDKFHHNEIGAKELEAALKNLEEVFPPPREGYCRLIHRDHVAGTSLSQSLPLEGAGNSSAGTNACGEGVPVGRVADVSRVAIFSKNGPLGEVDLESGPVKNNADPPAPGDVPSAVVGSRVYGENVPMTLIQVATGAYHTVTSKFAQASLTSTLATSIAALLLCGTKWKAAAPIVGKAGIIVCGVGMLADIGQNLPVYFFIGSLSTALLIITVAILSAKQSA